MGQAHKTRIDSDLVPELPAFATDHLLTSVIVNIPGAVYRCDPDPPWPMHFLTDGIEDITGYPASDFTLGDRTYGSIVVPEDLPVIDAQIAAAVAKGEPYALEYRIYHRDGGIRWLLERGRGALRENGTVRWLDGVIFDVTARKRAEEEAARLTQELREAHQALEIANARLVEEATTDGLTGLPNRRALHRRLAELVAEARRGRMFTLAIVDVDHFKELNDTFGHQIGDEAIGLVARALRSGIRAIDMAARYGGDEFCLLFVDVHEEIACNLAERTRSLIESIDGVPRKLTATFGLAAFGPSLATETALLKAADDALYRAKCLGRNCVAAFGSPRT
jgi:diguanylate cyclase (GGDEF)-like protein/PAS domain S-box-containing protein